MTIQQEDPTTKTIRDARIEARTTAQKKRLYQRAALLKGQSFTEFIESSLDEAAAKVQKEHQSMILTERDTELFVNVLLQNTQPSQRLIAAANRYKSSQQA